MLLGIGTPPKHSHHISGLAQVAPNHIHWVTQVVSLASGNLGKKNPTLLARWGYDYS